MVPPRQYRPPTTVPGGTLDDSRSEGSSTTNGNTTSRGVPGPKPRKAAATTGSVSTTSAPLASSKDLKVAAATGAVAAAAAAAAAAAGTMEYGENLRDLPGIPWHQMPLSILHDYRHAYKLSTPSAYARPISKLYFASGIGLRSPTAIAARKAASSSAAPTSSSASSVSMSTGSGAAAIQRSRAMNSRQVTSRSDSVLGRTRPKIHSQDRVGKEQLALAVRKHFNAAGLVEQDAIARFLYKVREEGKGREFRLRFQP